MTETTELENLPAPVEHRPVRVSPQADAGMAVLAAMSEREFESRLAALKSGRERVERIHRELLVEGTDFGVIPGVAKPSLLKPGAEKLIAFYGFAADFAQQVTYGKETGEPPITVMTRCTLHLGDLDGPVVAVGCGAANSWERRYRYRRGERVCPRCNKEGSLLRSKQKNGYFCWSKKGGCGAEFADDDERITSQVTGDVENGDPFDLLNVLLKMASKRALVDGALRATATSGVLTQDTEDLPAHMLPRPQEPPQSAPEALSAASVRGVAQRDVPVPKPPQNASQGRQRGNATPAPESVSTPYVSEVMEGQVVEHTAEGDPFAHDEPPEACQYPGCGTVLDEAEVVGSLKRGEEFGGRLLCKIHGKEARAAWRAAQQVLAEAAVAGEAVPEEAPDGG